MTSDTLAEVALSDIELVLQFESLGDNCELGLVQRRAGVEPLSMFRFAGAPVRHLIRAMEARFEGMADPANICVQPSKDEYMIKLTKYDVNYHAHVKIGEEDPQVLYQRQPRLVAFLVDKLIADLEQAEKIMVFRQNEEVSANDLLDLRAALSTYGPATLLWVQPTRPGHSPGTVVRVDNTLLIGYVTRLASRENAPDLDLRSWLVVLREAYRLFQVRPAVPRPAAEIVECPSCTKVIPGTEATDSIPNPVTTDSLPALAPTDSVSPSPPPGRTDMLFGREGNSGACLGYGWSGAENGFTWSIDDRSALTIVNPGPAETYCLEMDVRPYVAPPALLAQTMNVLINDHQVHRFDPLPRGKVSCAVPGHLVHGHDLVEIVLQHPKATSPREAEAGHNDDRRLAVAFRRLSLICS